MGVEPIILRRLGPPKVDDWHFYTGCPGWVDDGVRLLEKTTPSELRSTGGEICKKCIFLKGRNSRRPGKYEWH